MEEALPAVHALPVFEALRVVQAAVKAAELHTLRNGIKAAVFEIAAAGLGQMRKRSFPDLFRPKKELVLTAGKDIQEELRGVGNNVDRVEGMSAAQYREIRDGVQRKQEGTGQVEEVSHHEIRCPRLLQFGKTVKDIEGIAPFPFDEIVNVNGEGFKEMGKGHMYLRTPGMAGRMGSCPAKRM